MLQEAALIESCKGVDRALDQSQLLHVIVYVEVFCDLSPAFGENPGESSCFASDLAYDSFRK